jgi:hypothetical protein
MSIGNPTVDSIGTPFRVGAALSRAFQVFGAGFVKFVLLTALAFLPLIVVDLTFGSGAGNGAQAAHLLTTVLQLVLGPLANAACLYGAYQIMRGQSFSIGESLGAGLRRLGPVVGAALLVGILIGLAALALVVPAFMVACAFYVAVPACVIERVGPRASLKRSGQLTRGNRWGIFGLLILVAIGTIVLAGALAALGAVIGGAVLAAIFTFVAEVVVAAFGAVMAAVVYHDLRVAKEGVDIDQIAAVFD